MCNEFTCVGTMWDFFDLNEVFRKYNSAELGPRQVLAFIQIVLHETFIAALIGTVGRSDLNHLVDQTRRS